MNTASQATTSWHKSADPLPRLGQAMHETMDTKKEKQTENIKIKHREINDKDYGAIRQLAKES